LNIGPRTPSKIELRTNQTFVFVGDSITDSDRDLPAYAPLGFGYVHFVGNTLLAKYPQLNPHIVNSGVGGDTVYDLQDRWQKDCIQHRPDVLSVLIGVNDVWGRYADPSMLPTAVHPDEYKLTYRWLLSQAKQQCGCQLVLMEPFMFCNDPTNQVFEALQSYIETVQNPAQEFDAVLVPLQSKINKQIKHVPPEQWSADSVHPYLWAHAWIAQRWLEATGL
jgi:acyl-CoA thioesterase-1